MKDQLVLDLETQFEFAEVGGRDYVHLLKVSLVGVYSYLQDEFLSFEEHEIPKLEELLKNTDLIYSAWEFALDAHKNQKRFLGYQNSN